MMQRKEITVSAIRKGSVIDHIRADATFRVAEILDVDKYKNRVVIASNLDSQKLGKKGIIKIANLYLDKKCVQKIALIAPEATMSKIEDFKVIDKIQFSVRKQKSWRPLNKKTLFQFSKMFIPFPVVRSQFQWSKSHFPIHYLS